MEKSLDFWDSRKLNFHVRASWYQLEKRIKLNEFKAVAYAIQFGTLWHKGQFVTTQKRLDENVDDFLTLARLRREKVSQQKGMHSKVKQPMKSKPVPRKSEPKTAETDTAKAASPSSPATAPAPQKGAPIAVAAILDELSPTV